MRATLLLCVAVSALATVSVPTASAGLIGPPDPSTCFVTGATTCGTLTIGKVGPGSGTITSSPAGINCTVVMGVKSSTGCSASFSSQTATIVVTLVATPAIGSEVECLSNQAPPSPTPCNTAEIWSGGAKVTQEVTFTLTMYPVTVTKSGEGSGRVKSSVAGIDCGAKCSSSYAYETKLNLTATPDAGAVFKEWTGACFGQGATCSLTITEATSTNAVFGLGGAGGGQTGGQTTTPGAGGGTTSAAAVAADVIAASAGRSKLGKRVVRLELRLDEDVSATLTLLRRGTVLITKRFQRVREGERVLTLLVPRETTKGKATLTFELTDGQGNVLNGKRSVSIKRA